MSTPNNFRVKNGLTVSNGITVDAGSIIVGGGVTINSTSISSADISANTLNGNTASDLRSYTDTAYTNAVAYASNADNISSGTVDGTHLPIVDSVVDVSITNVASANSVTTTYNAAIAANTRAASAQSAATSAYANGVTYTDSLTDTAYSNATTFAANADNISSGTVDSARLPSANSTVAGAILVLDSIVNTSITIAASANSVKTAVARADAAYSNATVYALSAAGAAYSNATTYADSSSGTAYSNAIAYSANADHITSGTVDFQRLPTVDSIANTSISLVPVANNVKRAYDTAIAANTRAASAQTAATSAYSNAVTYTGSFAANADNISSGTLAAARLPFSMDQDVQTTDTVTFSAMTITGNLIVQGTTTTVNTETLSVEDNMIYLNANSTVTNPDLGFAGNYNDGVYQHAGIFRDADDGYWKVFDSYTPEPDATPYINTAHTSFTLNGLHVGNARFGNTSSYSTINSTSLSISTITTTGAVTLGGNLDVDNNNLIDANFNRYTENITTNSTATGGVTINCALGNFFNWTITGNITSITFSNVPSGVMYALTIAAKQNGTGGYTITWPASVLWPGNLEPPASTGANDLDIWSLMTYDGGTTWIGSLTVKDAS